MENGSRLSEEVSAALEETASLTGSAVEFIDQVVDNVVNQAESISQIAEGIDQISSVVQTNSATAEQSAAASEELSGQAGVMKNLLDQFQLKADKPASGSPVAADDQFSSVPSASAPTHYLSDKY